MSDDWQTFVFAGGGTGGHLFPGIAVAQELLERDERRIVFVGSDRAIESRILASLNRGAGLQPAEFAGENAGSKPAPHDRIVAHEPLEVDSTATLRRHPFRFVRRLWSAFRRSKRLLRELQPSVVIGLGGFASIPVGLAAWRLGIPIVLLEQNTVPGRATRLLCRFARAACLSFEQSASFLAKRCETRLSGNPVRREFAEAARTRPGRQQVETEVRTLLVLGGSQGSMSVNDLVVALVKSQPSRLAGWRIIHQTGAADLDRVQAAYDLVEHNMLQLDVQAFIEDMHTALSSADLVVARAGATTLAEVACCGCPAMLIPYPNSIHDHQLLNAKFYADANAAVVFEQTRDPNEFSTVVESLVSDSRTLQDMASEMKALASPDATGLVADLIEQIACSED